MLSFISITKALSDENRLRALMALKGRELCVCQITELLQLAPSTVSKHMSILRQARLVSGRKKGRWMFYRPATDSSVREVRQALSWVHASLAGTDRVRRDAQRLEEILKIPREKLCRSKGATKAA